MDSSSENSFAWTDTSNDSDSTSMAADDINDKSGKNGKHNNVYINKTKGNKSISKTVYNNESEDKEHETDVKEKKKKMIKLEPESDIDLPKKKKKDKHSEMNGDQTNLENLMAYDESYLNKKVKLEAASASHSTKHKHKKLKHKSSIDSTLTKSESTENNVIDEISDRNLLLKQETEYYTEVSKPKKKKKKSKQKDDNDHNQEIECKTDIETTNVNKTNIESKYSHADSSMGENSTLQDESEGSGCDEISAIKYDDDHDLHTISLINKYIDEENTKKYDGSLTIGNQHKLPKNSTAVLESNKTSEGTRYRMQRISDRIRFEDDDDGNIESSQLVNASDYVNNEGLSKLKQFVGRNSNLKIISQKFDNKSSITIDDDLWILKCPKDIDIQDFNNTSLNIEGKCKIKVGGQTYDVSTAEEQSDTLSVLTIECSKYKIRNLPLSGVIHLRKRIPKAHYRDDNIMVNNQTNFIPLPETKCRHPLFGLNYKKALKIPAAIAQRLNMQDSELSSMKSEKKKKKSKKDKNSSKETDIQSELNMKSEPTIEIYGKKKKKRKIMDDEGPVPKKVKRIKHDPESAEAWESEKAIEENLFNY